MPSTSLVDGSHSLPGSSPLLGPAASSWTPGPLHSHVVANPQATPPPPSSIANGAASFGTTPVPPRSAAGASFQVRECIFWDS